MSSHPLSSRHQAGSATNTAMWLGLGQLVVSDLQVDLGIRALGGGRGVGGPWGCRSGPSLASRGVLGVPGQARGGRALPVVSRCPLSPHRLEQPYFSANAQFFQALSQCSALQRLCLVSRSGTLQPEAVLAFMARCLHVVVCHLFTGESLSTCRSLQQSLLRR